MKKQLTTPVLAMLCLIFSSKAQAQTPAKTPTQTQNQAIDVTSTGIQIGQKVPETNALSKYKGKLIILDFWATWCGPCVAMIPKMEALQTQFNEQIQILPVTYESKEIVEPFLKKLHKGKASNLPEITGDKELHKLFPHIYLPHYVWIDKEGIVSAITGMEEITADNIQKMLTGPANPTALKQKRDMKIAYDKTKPYLINGNGGDGSNLIYRSLLSSYQEGINSGYDRLNIKGNGKRLFMRNVTIPFLFQEAMHSNDKFFDHKRTIFEVKDSIPTTYPPRFSPLMDQWQRQNLYCYDLIVPGYMAGSFQEIMLAEVSRLFPQYTIDVITKTTPSYVLVQTAKTDKLKSTHTAKEHKMRTSVGGCTIVHGSLDILVKRLDLIYMRAPIPVMNDTDITYPIDLDLQVDFSNFEELNAALKTYDLQFIKKDWPIEFLVFKDAIAKTNKL